MDAEFEKKLIEKYGEHVVFEAYDEFSELEREYKKELAQLKADEIKQRINFSEHNKLFRTHKEYDAESPKKAFEDKFAAKEHAIVKKLKPEEKESEKEELSKIEKWLQAKENSTDATEAIKSHNEPDDQEKKNGLDIDNKQESFAKSIDAFKEQEKAKTEKPWSVANKEKNGEIKMEFDQNREDITKRAFDEERAKIIAEINAAKERNHENERDR